MMFHNRSSLFEFGAKIHIIYISSKDVPFILILAIS